jgi:C1A family cysteine protease
VKTLRQLSVSLLVASTAVLAACGHTAPVNSVAGLKDAGLPTAMMAGHARKFGYNLSRFQHELKFSQHPVHFARRGPAPASVDNRQFCSPVADQGQLGSCTAFSMAKGLREYLQNKNGEKATPMSALWLYYNERAHMGAQYIKQDSGANMSDGNYVLSNQGCATEASWGYNIAKFTVKPPAAADASAAAWKIKSAANLATVDDVKAAVAAGQPVVFGFTVYESFEAIGADGVMPDPKPGESVLGGHAVMVVGYDDQKQQLTVRNSWGGGWGDKGYFYMSYKFASDVNNAMDWWTAAN